MTKPVKVRTRKAPATHVPVDMAEVDRLYWSEGLSVRKIAARFGVSSFDLRERMGAAGIVIRSAPQSNRLHSRTPGGVNQDVVGQGSVQVGVDWNGRPEMLLVDYLECGHKVESLREAVVDGDTLIWRARPSIFRTCRSCTLIANQGEPQP